MVCASGKKHKRFYERLGLTRETPFAPRPHCAIDLCLMTVPLKIEPFLQQTMMEREQLDAMMPDLSPIFTHIDCPSLQATA
ncbi:hypothetical protein AT251_20745 [Enterovibrio nigricans]|uniref:Uncharacterized protein n=1 Tax=Enterovibrio nigricans DSM 22720 TaxID=1121868 RepID=A0A1T4VYQ5_9GAMM|nr:hypothetical protein AT251_20745 [Enterovibrio nigricans]SKA70162.1 hypothetical protein SAMN02745132_04545 [Enterovibrio nigricans DSM 22720]